MGQLLDLPNKHTEVHYYDNTKARKTAEEMGGGHAAVF